MSKNSELHAAECEANWKHQGDANRRYEAELTEIFKRLNQLEIRLATLSAIGGCVGALIGKLF